MTHDKRGVLKLAFEEAVSGGRFNMERLSSTVLDILRDTEALNGFEEGVANLEAPAKRRVFYGLLRNAFLVQFVRTRGGAAVMDVRWSSAFGATDPRRAPFDVCLEMFLKLIAELCAYPPTQRYELLTDFTQYTAVPYQLPLDYVSRDTSCLHRVDNMAWLPGELPIKVAKLRKYLLSLDEARHRTFFREAYKKIRVKAYLTDRAQTGDFQTNRERRWEVHPGSVQFALHRQCIEIEYQLINQICHFLGFPEDLRLLLEGEDLLEPMELARCPITMEPLSFEEFEAEVLEPVHGRANFQVGHLNPLKAQADEPGEGHSALNISWISADGNRIQGHLALDATRDLLLRIARNYQEAGLTR